MRRRAGQVNLNGEDLAGPLIPNIQSPLLMKPNWHGYKYRLLGLYMTL